LVQRLLELIAILGDTIAQVLGHAVGALVMNGAQHDHIGDSLNSILNGSSDGVLRLGLELCIDNCLLLLELFDLLNDFIDLLPKALLRSDLAFLLVVKLHGGVGRDLILELLNVAQLLVSVSNLLAKSHFVRMAVGRVLRKESSLDEVLLGLCLLHCVSLSGLAKDS
jgi:hypothetical protein